MTMYDRNRGYDGEVQHSGEFPVSEDAEAVITTLTKRMLANDRENERLRRRIEDILDDEWHR
jgi:hypothetical protein